MGADRSGGFPDHSGEHAGYRDDYPTCERAFAALYFTSPRLDLETVTRVIGSQATLAWGTGDPLAQPDGSAGIAGRGAWALRTAEGLHSHDLRRHIDWVLDMLEPRSAAVADLQQDGYEVVLWCHWRSRWGYGGPTFSVRQMARAAALGIPLRLDFYEVQESGE